MNKTIITGTAVAGALLLAACSSNGQAAPAAAQRSLPVLSAPATAATFSLSLPARVSYPSRPVKGHPYRTLPGPGPVVPMTRKEAAARYVAIIDPGNRVNDTLGTDWADRAPWARYVTDSRAYVRAMRVEVRQFRAARWPARVQPYITSMLLTFEADSIRCARREAAAGSYGAAETAYYASQACTSAEGNTDPDTIRSMLGLPARY